jgi:hypothetical protein
MVSEPS